LVAEFLTQFHEFSEDLGPTQRKRTLFTSNRLLKNIGKTFFRGQSPGLLKKRAFSAACQG
jgi:hypothetical protein